MNPRVAGALLAGWLAACGSAPQPQTAPADWEVLDKEALRSSRGAVDFHRHVKPVLEAKCVVCHNRETLPHSSFESRALAFALPSRIVPGHPERSGFIVSAAEVHARLMPPVGECWTRNEKRILADWVRQGAAWPLGPEGDLRPNGTTR